MDNLKMHIKEESYLAFDEDKLSNHVPQTRGNIRKKRKICPQLYHITTCLLWIFLWYTICLTASFQTGWPALDCSPVWSLWHTAIFLFLFFGCCLSYVIYFLTVSDAKFSNACTWMEHKRWATVIWLFEYVCTVGSCVLFTLPPLQPMFFLYLPTVYICKMFLLGPTYIFLSIHLPPHHTNYCLLYAQNLLYICTLFCNSHCLENKLKNHRLLNIYFSSWILSLSNLIFY